MNSNTQRGAAVHGATSARVQELTQALDGANDTIRSLHREQEERAGEWHEERMKMSYRIHNGKYRVNRLEGLIDLREHGFKEELQQNIRTISKQETEIFNLKNTLKLKEEQMEAAQRLHQQQVEQICAQLEAERQKVSELRDQMFKASLQSQKTASLHKQSQMMLENVKQQLQQRDEFIQELRKEKEGLSDRLINTTAQLKKKDPWEQKFKALQEQLTKEKEEKQKEVSAQIGEMEQEKRDLEEEMEVLTCRDTESEEENRSFQTKILQLQMENNKLSEQKETLTTKAEKAEVEKGEMVLKETTLKARIKDLEERNATWTRRAIVAENRIRFINETIRKLETENVRLFQQEQSLITKAEKVEEMIEKEKTLTNKIKELEEEKAQLILIITKKKRGLWEKTFNRETEEEKTLRKHLKAKKKELKEMKQNKEEVSSVKEEEEEEEEAPCCSSEQQ